MEQTENKSTYAGRKIRIEEKDDLKEAFSSATVEEAEQGGMTLREAASKGLLKTGMIVVFKDCISKPIKLTKEMTGKKQEIQYELNKGVIFQRKDGSYAILAVLLCHNEKLILKGRYARANSLVAIKYIINSVFKNKARLFSLQELAELGSTHYLINSYLMQEEYHDKSILVYKDENNEGVDYVHNLQHEHYHFDPGGKESYFSTIAVTIEAQDVQGCIKKNSPTEIKSLNSYEFNPYDKHVEIRGVML